jgi:hypothetical protein
VPRPDPQNLFELTPFGYGSPRWGYTNTGPDQLKTLARGVRASAAFADAQGIGNTTLAERVNKASDSVYAAKWGVPFVHEAAPRAKLRLSDGGGADNLALVSAVHRGLADVIIADSAQDGRGLMEDLCWSDAFLKKEGFKDMKFGALPDLPKVCEDMFNDTQPPGKVYDLHAWVNPVVYGTLTGPDGKEIRLWLLKPAWNEKEAENAFNSATCGFDVGNFNCMLAMFWGTRFNPGPDGTGVTTFPQHGTVALTYNGSPTLLLAYRELGRMAARHLKREENGRISLIGGKQLCQRTLQADRGAPKCPTE